MKKIGLLCLALVLALGGLGIGYASWSDTVTVTGTVNTGTLSWEFLDGNFTSKDVGLDWTVDDLQVLPSLYPLDKDVGSTTGVFSDSDGDGDLDTLTVTIDNAYPSYANDIAFWVHCNGSIPMHFEKIIINPGGVEITAEFPPVIKLDLNDDGNNDIEILWGNHIGVQFHSSNNAEISFLIHVLQAAPQGATLNFSIIMEAVQWNESIHYP